MLTLCWSDGTSCLPADFALESSANAHKRLCQASKTMYRRCCAYQRRNEATGQLQDMVRQLLEAGITARYLLMDNWFTIPVTVDSLAGRIPVIEMVKKIKTVHYRFQGQSLNLMTIYRRLKSCS